MEKIEHPKVFISYAWGSEDYQDKVLAFASELVENGVDVVFDRWSLKEGHDSYAFMEQSVNDPSITNVIILLDPVYAQKADSRTGGVGTETQIISPEIYNNTTQEKFIPVVFERNENGEVCKPSYLKGLLHFDLSHEEVYDSEYQRLVKRLYGRESVKKPELGIKPVWVDQESVVKTKVRISYDVLKSNQPEIAKREAFLGFLSEIKDHIINYTDDTNPYSEILYHYEQMQSTRDQFLLLLKYSVYIENGASFIADFFEEILDDVASSSNVFSNTIKTLLHELFIYTIAYFYKLKDNVALAGMFCKTYYIGGYREKQGESFPVFRFHNDAFDKAVCKRDDKKYISGTAQWWIEHLNTEICSQSQFVFADVLCFNASVLICEIMNYWFPISYIYGDRERQSLSRFANKIRSKTNLLDVCEMFGFNNSDELKAKLRETEDAGIRNEIKRYRYHERFDPAPFLGYYIKAEELGINR